MRLKPIAAGVLQLPWRPIESPTLAEMPERIHGVFAPLERVLDAIETSGDVLFIDGRAAFSTQGSWFELCVSIDYLVDFHEIVTIRTGRQVDLSGLQKLANKLHYGTPMEERDIDRARACIADCKRHAAALTVVEAKEILDAVKTRYEVAKLLGKNLCR